MDGELLRRRFRVLEGKEGVRRLYDDLAEIYDHSRLLYLTRRLERCEEEVTREWLERIDPPILDVGCGSGRYSLKSASKGVETISIDLSLKMLKVLLKKLEDHGLKENVHVILADGENLPLRDDSLRGLLCTLTFDHFQEPKKAISEFSRVLRVGGLCVISTLNKEHLKLLRRLLGISADKVPFLGETIPPTLVYETGHTGLEIQQMLSIYGFKSIKLVGCCYWGLFTPFIPEFMFKLLEKLLVKLKNFMKHAALHVVVAKKFPK